jgi:hypothetical protein
MTSTGPVTPMARSMSLPAIAATALCVFLLVLTFLAWNLQMGHDPALGTYTVPAQHVVAPGKSHPVAAPVTRSSGGG